MEGVLVFEDFMEENLALWQRTVSIPALWEFSFPIYISGLMEKPYPGVQAWIDIVPEVHSTGLMTAWLQKQHEQLIYHIFPKASDLNHNGKLLETDTM